jgi:hypothetical protein
MKVFIPKPQNKNGIKTPKALQKNLEQPASGRKRAGRFEGFPHRESGPMYHSGNMALAPNLLAGIAVIAIRSNVTEVTEGNAGGKLPLRRQGAH